MLANLERVFTGTDDLCKDTSTGTHLHQNLILYSAIAATGFFAYGALIGVWNSPTMAISAATKLPLLFLVTLVITLPSLHFIGLYMGSQIRLLQTLVVMMHGMATIAVLLVSAAPIVLFFMLSRPSYAFMVLMHVAVVGAGSCAGMATIHRNIHVISTKANDTVRTANDLALPVWTILFASVGTQMAYMTRPYIGHSEQFALLRAEGGTFYEAVLNAMMGMLG